MVDEKHVKKVEEKGGRVTIEIELEPIKDTDFNKPYITYRVHDVKSYLESVLDKPIESCYLSGVVSNRSEAICKGVFGFKTKEVKNAAKKTTPRKQRARTRKNIVQRIPDLEGLSVPTQAEVQRQDTDSTEDTNIHDNGDNSA